METAIGSSHLAPINCNWLESPVLWGPGVRDCYILHYVYAGHGVLEAGGQAYPVGTGQSFLIYPNSSVLYYPDPHIPWSYIWVDFVGDEANLLLRKTAFSEQQPVCPEFPPNEVLPLFHAVRESSGPELWQQCRAGGCLTILLSYYLEHFPAQKTIAQSPPYLQNAIRFVTANIHRQISVQDIADHLNISRAQLYRIFMAQLSLSPSDYLTQVRMNYACSLLADSSLSIKEIAYSVGFDNPLYFTKVFHKTMGSPPSQYRRKPEANSTPESTSLL